MIKIKNKYFNISQIALSGQCFRIERIADVKYRVIFRDKYVSLRQYGEEISFDCTFEEFENVWRDYFDLDTDYGRFVSSADKDDEYLLSAVKFGKGIRILKQDFWETLVSFIISQQNNIPRIKKCVTNICESYGEKKTASDGTTYYSFPLPSVLAAQSEDALVKCNLGYRSKYVVRAAREIESSVFIPDKLYQLPYEKAKSELMKLYGVGSKVADCVCLFALHKIEAFPVDTHIKQVLKERYNNAFPFEKYKGFAGVMQQYMFYYDYIGSKRP